MAAHLSAETTSRGHGQHRRGRPGRAVKGLFIVAAGLVFGFGYLKVMDAENRLQQAREANERLEKDNKAQADRIGEMDADRFRAQSELQAELNQKFFDRFVDPHHYRMTAVSLTKCLGDENIQTTVELKERLSSRLSGELTDMSPDYDRLKAAGLYQVRIGDRLAEFIIWPDMKSPIIPIKEWYGDDASVGMFVAMEYCVKSLLKEKASSLTLSGRHHAAMLGRPRL